MARQGSSLVNNTPMGVFDSTARQRGPTLRRGFEHQALCRLRPNSEVEPVLHCNFQSAIRELSFPKPSKSTPSDDWTAVIPSLKCDFVLEKYKSRKIVTLKASKPGTYIRERSTLDQWEPPDPHFNQNKQSHHVLLKRRVMRKSVSKP
jgi:hypothetical protein